MQYFEPNWAQGAVNRPARPGIDWGKVRLNFSYDEPESRLPDDNVVFLQQPEQDNTVLYILGGVAGVLGLILLMRR